MPSSFRGFSPEALDFLHDLKLNNRREWFQPRKQIFEEQVRGPMIELVAALNEPLSGISPELVADPKKAVYRIYRDTRFSNDKSPYKTQIAAVFSPRGLDKHAGAGLYFHISTDEVMVGGGIYAPSPPDLLKVRRHVAAHGEKLGEIARGRTFRRLFREITGERLKRVPKGFAADHPHADLLTFKQYLVLNQLPPGIATKPKLFRELVKHFEAMIPLLRFLNAPLMPRKAAGKRAGGRA